MPNAIRLALVLGSIASLMACDRLSQPTPQERVGYLRELVRARTVSGDTVPIDACSIGRFMVGVPAWRDSLVPAERTLISESATCADTAAPIPGRFVLTNWYRNWSGEYVIRGTVQPWDHGYRFTDGIFVGRELFTDQQPVAGIADRRAPADTARGAVTGDSIRRAGSLGDTLAEPLPDALRDTTRRRP
ncbi:MAG TPA: hypothetical protein VE861_01770 [Gemmatimonadaceae bacterium]|nr:hypothetical protein [Gemmatimonadaceae bacterium]